MSDTDFAVEPLRAEEHERRKRLSLRRGAHVFLDGEVFWKLLDLVCAELRGMTQAVKPYEVLDQWMYASSVRGLRCRTRSFGSHLVE